MLALLLAAALTAPAESDHKLVIAELGRQADVFERNADRVVGIETFRQTVPSGVRVATNSRGTEVRLPGFTREIVSEYGFLTEDVRGGSLREVRMVLKVDGLNWKRGTRSIESLSRQLTARDDKLRRKQLEAWEDFGLSGFITDVGQLILLFARGNTAHYDIRFEGVEGQGADTLWRYAYQQREGAHALTVHGESAQPKRERLAGRLWIRAEDRLPVRISLESERKDSKGVLRDVITVSYFLSPFGTLLPVRILHQQHGDDLLLVTNEFTYSNYKRVLPPSRRK